jgi:hypothetical protein
MSTKSFRVVDQGTGKEVFPGDTVTNFRGERATFEGVERGKQPGKSAKVRTDRGVHYEGVYGLDVTEAPPLRVVNR